MTWYRFGAALFYVTGVGIFAATCALAPATHGASLVFGVLAGGVLFWAGHELWRE